MFDSKLIEVEIMFFYFIDSYSIILLRQESTPGLCGILRLWSRFFVFTFQNNILFWGLKPQAKLESWHKKMISSTVTALVLRLKVSGSNLVFKATWTWAGKEKNGQVLVLPDLNPAHANVMPKPLSCTRFYTTLRVLLKHFDCIPGVF